MQSVSSLLSSQLEFSLFNAVDRFTFVRTLIFNPFCNDVEHHAHLNHFLPSCSPPSYRNASSQEAPWFGWHHHFHCAQCCSNRWRCRSDRLQVVSYISFVWSRKSEYPRWRNRGKLLQEQPRNETVPEPDFDALTPPPPYDAPSYHKQDFKVPEPIHVVPLSPPSSPKKPRHAQHSRPNKRPLTHRRRKSHRTHPDHHSFSSSLDPYYPQSSTQSEFVSETDQVEDKMDWIGDKLSMLIEQGKRALHTHVVVSSDAKEDEVDDGSDAWEEEEEHDVNRSSPRQSRSRSGSVRQLKRPMPLNLGAGPSTSSAYIHHPSSSTDFSFPSARLPTSHSTASLNNVSVEDSSTFESPELRESMNRARQRLMARRLGGA